MTVLFSNSWRRLSFTVCCYPASFTTIPDKCKIKRSIRFRIDLIPILRLIHIGVSSIHSFIFYSWMSEWTKRVKNPAIFHHHMNLMINRPQTYWPKQVDLPPGIIISLNRHLCVVNSKFWKSFASFLWYLLCCLCTPSLISCYKSAKSMSLDLDFPSSI